MLNCNCWCNFGSGTDHLCPSAFQENRYGSNTSCEAGIYMSYSAISCKKQTPNPHINICRIRKMPVVLPHDLVPQLVKAELWPLQGVIDRSDVTNWWDHMVKTTWLKNHPGKEHQKHEPLFLYGDDACMTKAGNEKMVVVTLSHCLDTRKSSRLTSWPLFLFRHVS